MARHIAKIQQNYTQRGGVRPFGVSTLIVGFDSDKKPQIYQTDPAGTYSAWKAHAIGSNQKNLQDYLLNNYKEGNLNRENLIRLMIKTLLEVIDSGAKNMEIAVLKYGEEVEFLKEEEIEVVIKDIERELEELKKKEQESNLNNYDD